MLDFAFLAVAQFDLNFYFWRRRFVWPAIRWTWWFTDRRLLHWLFWFAVSFGVGEVIMGIDKIVDGEIFLAIEETRSAPDDLLKFDDCSDRTH